MGRWILFVLTLPMAILGWAWILCLRLIGAAGNLRWEPFMVLSAVRRGKMRMFSGWSFAMSRSVLYAPGIRQPVGVPWHRAQEHEHVHVRQAEDGCLFSFLVGLAVALSTGDWLVGLLIWCFGDWVRWAAHGASAVLRGGRFYRDAENERSAYAQTDRPDGRPSWLMTREHRASTPSLLPVEGPPILEPPGCLICGGLLCDGTCDRDDGLPT